jgi:hypothetical protein
MRCRLPIADHRPSHATGRAGSATESGSPRPGTGKPLIG